MNDEGQIAQTSNHVRFGAFEVNLRSGELRKHGIKIKLQEKPFQILALLVEQPGEVVTREELHHRLWPADTFVDFDRNLNTAANRLRQALGDSADSPRFIETIPRRGYRLIVPVERTNGGGNGNESSALAANGALPEEARAGKGQLAAAPPKAWQRAVRTVTRPALAILVLLVLVAAGIPKLRDGVWAIVARSFATGGSAHAGKTMLVVLPFENLSGDPQQDYVSDGLTEEMIAQIGRLNPERLGVIARTSAMHYKGTRESVAEIGKELGVDYALEGSVRRGSGRVLITAQLVPVHDVKAGNGLVSAQTPLWSHTYERDESDLLSIQQDVAAHIAGALAVELLPASGSSAGNVAPNPEAHEEYLLGRYYWNKRTMADVNKGLASFQRAAQLDPNFAPAFAGIADSYLVLASQFALPPQQAYPKARAAAERALQVNPSLAEAYTSLAGVTFQYDWDWPRAEQQFQRAIQLDPGYTTAHQWYAFFLSSMGRHSEALREIQVARRLDPLSRVILTTEGNIYFQARQYDQAAAACQRALDLDPNFALARVCLAIVYVKLAEASPSADTQASLYHRAVLERYRALSPEGYAKEEQEGFWQAYAADGIQGVRRWLIDYRAKRIGPGGFPRHNDQFIPGYYMAVLYAGLGEKDQAFEWLERSYEQRDSFLTRLKVDPNLDNLRSDPRFAAFLKRMKLD